MYNQKDSQARRFKYAQMLGELRINLLKIVSSAYLRVPPCEEENVFNKLVGESTEITVNN